MTTFLEIWNALKTRTPAPPDECKAAVRGAWRKICGEHDWSFLRGEGFLFIPTVVNTGQVTAIDATRRILTLNSAANTALSTSNTTDRPVVGRQFRYTNGPLYTINAFASSQITLDRAFVDTSAVPLSYQIYQAYYPPPKLADGTTDFLRFSQIAGVSRNIAWPPIFAGTREWLDWTDRLRARFGPPERFVPYLTDSSGTPRFEAWPHPTAEDTLICYFRRRGDLLFSEDADVLTSPMSEEAIFNRALYVVYEWCVANASGGSENDAKLRQTLSGVNWFNLMAKAKADYEDDLGECWKLDQEAFPPQHNTRGHGDGAARHVQWQGQYVPIPSGWYP